MNRKAIIMAQQRRTPHRVSPGRWDREVGAPAAGRRGASARRAHPSPRHTGFVGLPGGAAEPGGKEQTGCRADFTQTPPGTRLSRGSAVRHPRTTHANTRPPPKIRGLNDPKGARTSLNITGTRGSFRPGRQAPAGRAPPRPKLPEAGSAPIPSDRPGRRGASQGSSWLRGH